MSARAPSLADFEAPELAPAPALTDFSAEPIVHRDLKPANDARSPLALPASPASAAAKEDRMRHLSALLNQPLGLVRRTAFAAYLAAPGTNASRLKDLAHSPRLYHHRLTVPREPTDPMRLGSCAHTAVLEPEKFLSEYALWDERTENDPEKVSPRRGKRWDTFVLANPGKQIVRADEHAAAMAMREAVRANRDAMRYLAKGDPEVAMWWCDSATERLCKGRADWITTVDGAPVLVGLKTARDCRAEPFGIAAAKLGYALQWAFYQDGYAAITGQRPRVVEIVVESAEPHDVGVYGIPDDVLEAGRLEYTRLLGVLGDCERANVWPGAAEGEQTLRLPKWARPAGDGDVGELPKAEEA